MKRRDVLISIAAGAGVAMGLVSVSAAQSGARLDGAVAAFLGEVKDPNSKYLFSVYKLSDDGRTVLLERKYPETDAEKKEVAAMAPNEKTLAQNFETKIWPIVQKAVPSADPRYVIVKVSGVDKTGAVKKGTLFYAWTPDAAPIKKKMAYTEAKDSLRKAAVGISIDAQATDIGEFDLTRAKEKLGTL